MPEQEELYLERLFAAYYTTKAAVDNAVDLIEKINEEYGEKFAFAA